MRTKTTPSYERTSQMAKVIDAHAEALMRIPSGEQFIAHIQSVVSIALADIARWIDTVEAERIADNQRNKKTVRDATN